MAIIPHVERGKLIQSGQQNAMIDQLNDNTSDIEDLKAASGDPEAVQGMIDESLFAHINDLTPHPAYDDIPSLSTLFENGLA